MRTVHFALLFCLSIFIISCKKDQPEEQKPKEENIILKCIPTFGVAISHNGHTPLKYIYNLDGQIINILNMNNDTSKWSPYLKVTYNSQNNIMKIQDVRKLGGYTEYTYNNAGLLSQANYYGFNDKEDQYPTLQYINFYEYGANGRPVEINIRDRDNALLAKTNFVYDLNGNILQVTDSIRRENKFEFSSLKEFRYDDKINPYYAVALPNNIVFSGPNNVIYRKTRYQNINEITLTETHYKYTYNSNNLPEDVEISMYNPRFGTGIGTGFFRYNCN